MNKIIISACVIAGIFFSACNNGKGVDYDTSLPAVQPKANNEFPVANSETTNLQTSPEAPVQGNPGKSVALNPEHGQPGHRCDIAVGTPLNSPAQQVPQAAPQTSPVLPAQFNNGGSSVMLNPEHGMPGHDCAIAVGQPLKS